MYLKYRSPPPTAALPPSFTHSPPQLTHTPHSHPSLTPLTHLILISPSSFFFFLLASPQPQVSVIPRARINTSATSLSNPCRAQKLRNRGAETTAPQQTHRLGPARAATATIRGRLIRQNQYNERVENHTTAPRGNRRNRKRKRKKRATSFHCHHQRILKPTGL